MERRPQCNVYGRFKKAIKFSSPLEQSPPSPPPLNYPNSPEHPKASGKPVPIEFDQSTFSRVRTNKPVAAGLKAKPVRSGGSDPGENETELESYGQFSDFIKRTKMKMRRNMTIAAGSDGAGGTGKGVSRLESINKNMIAYMDRAKGKMRTAGVGKKPD